jgi:hypothetical protein
MSEKYEIILAAEESFSRKVALGVIVSRPLTVWHYLIPGMFIFNFLRRTSEVKRYSEHFLFPRRVAIHLAQVVIRGGKKEESLSRAEDEIRAWLTSLNVYSEALRKAKMEMTKFLTEHYSRLLKVDGNSHEELIKNAYKDKGSYEAHLSQLTSLEDEVDRAIVETLGEGVKLRERLLVEKTQVDKLRRQTVEEIF